MAKQTNYNIVIIITLFAFALVGIGASVWVLVESQGAGTNQSFETTNQTPTVVVNNVYESDCNTVFNSSIKTGASIAGGSNPKEICIKGTATDPDGCSTITAVEGMVYRNTATSAPACTPDENDCYSISDISFDVGTCIGATDTTVDFTGSVDLEWWAYHTQFTESANYWDAWVQVTDDEAVTGAGTSPNWDINRTSSVGVSTNALSFGTRTLGTTGPDPSDVELELVNLGNEITDVEFRTSSSYGGWLVCSNFGNVNHNYVHFAWTDTWTWGVGDYYQSSSYQTATDADIARSTDGTTTSARKTAYHMILLPGSGVSGTCSNTVTWNATPN